MRKPDPSLAMEVAGPDGSRTRWDSTSPDPTKRPLSPWFETESGEGFARGGVDLRRRIDRHSPDLRLLQDFRMFGRTGKIAYEGRITGAPSGELISVDLTGWMSHARQRRIVEFIVERDASRWAEIPNYRRAIGLAFGKIFDSVFTASSADGVLSILGTAGQAVPNNATTELAYLAPAGCRVKRVQYQGSEGNLTNVGAASLISADPDGVTNQVSNAITLDGTLRSLVLAATARLLILGSSTTAAFTPSSAHRRQVTQHAVFGDTGIPTLVRDGEPDGVSASEVIKYLAGRYAPKLDTSGVQPTGYAIPNVVWREPIEPHECMKQVNSFHRWRLAVWENRRLEFGPYDLTVSDWIVRDGFNGVRVESQGDTSEYVFNGCAVNYTGFDGIAGRVTPEDTVDLADTSDWIAANQWGDQAWLEHSVSWPCTRDDAIELGRLALVDANRRRQPSTITVPWHIQDRNGSWHPCWEARADQTISVLNHPSPTPRLITKTTWRDNLLTITTDNAIDSRGVLDARIMGALTAGGLV